ncbi:MAG: CerR family C-terminal domain-containing protein [Vicinamibacterales bacterium]
MAQQHRLARRLPERGATAARRRVGRVDDEGETRQRLLDAARRLFAEQGYRRVTVREICGRAGANVAAINYHFGGKQGLYREILDEAIVVMRETSELAMRAGQGATVEQRLRAFIRVFIQRVSSEGNPWIRQLMAHEMAEPTDGLDHVVQEAIVPRIEYMKGLVAEILGADEDDERVWRCVLSVQSQFHTIMAKPVAERLVPGMTGDPASLERLARHIADFSIGGIRSLRRSGGAAS